uniref:Uncharacterized protein n=1 Tax=Balaenoptera musculus TaxID=9771 RepID=A0A8C0E0E7_BALMU
DYTMPGVGAGRHLYKDTLLKDQYCILILGLDDAVRTTVLERSKTRFHKNSKGMILSKITTTAGLNLGTVDAGKARLLLRELQSLWDKDQAEGHGVLYVMASTEEERLSGAVAFPIFLSSFHIPLLLKSCAVQEKNPEMLISLPYLLSVRNS